MSFLSFNLKGLGIMVTLKSKETLIVNLLYTLKVDIEKP